MSGPTDEAREEKVNQRAIQQGYLLRKDPLKTFSTENQGGYMLINSQNTVVAGENFELTLDQVEEFLKGQENRP